MFDSGISSAAVTAVLLNLLFNVGRRGEPTEAALVAESPTVGVTPGLRRARRSDDTRTPAGAVQAARRSPSEH